MSHEKFDQLLTSILTVVGVSTGTAGLWLAQVDLIMAVCLKFISILATLLVIAVNWEKGSKQFKDWFKR
jgi:hypothetical protein